MRLGSSAAVESLYLAQHSITADELPRLRTEFMGCLRDAGIEGIRTDMTDAVIAQNLVRQGGGIEAWTCRERYLILSGDVGARPAE